MPSKKKYPARVRRFNVGKKYAAQPFTLASKHHSKRDAIGKAGLLRIHGFAARVVYSKSDKIYAVYANKLFGRKK